MPQNPTKAPSNDAELLAALKKALASDDPTAALEKLRQQLDKDAGGPPRDGLKGAELAEASRMFGFARHIPQMAERIGPYIDEKGTLRIAGSAMEFQAAHAAGRVGPNGRLLPGRGSR